MYLYIYVCVKAETFNYTYSSVLLAVDSENQTRNKVISIFYWQEAGGLKFAFEQKWYMWQVRVGNTPVVADW